MKNILTIFAVLLCATAFSQTVISSTTTVSALSLMANGQYRIINGTDTLDLSKDTSLILTKTVTIHDTIPRICPICPTCPPPVVCPTCPAQRLMVGLSYNPVTNQWIVTYNDGGTSIFVPTKTMFLQ